jgi:hypothetical protein
VAITLISKEEQYKFARIEKLLEKEVTKSSVPEEFGDTPAYDPSKNRGRSGGFRGSGRSKGGSQSKGGGKNRGKGNYKGHRSGSRPTN